MTTDWTVVDGDLDVLVATTAGKVEDGVTGEPARLEECSQSERKWRATPRRRGTRSRSPGRPGHALQLDGVATDWPWRGRADEMHVAMRERLDAELR